MRSRKIRIFSILAVSALCAGGCGGGVPSAPSTKEEATVKGTVTLHGKPVTEGEVLFDPSNINRRDAPTVKSKIEKDGSYTVKTLVGENNIMISGAAIAKDPTVTMPKKFVDVKSGENNFPIELP